MYKTLYFFAFSVIALAPRLAIGNEHLSTSHMGEEGDGQYSKKIGEVKKALLKCIADGEYEEFVSLWKNSNKYVTSNRQLQEILIWRSFIEKNTIFLNISSKTPMRRAQTRASILLYIHCYRVQISEIDIFWKLCSNIIIIHTGLLTA